MTHDRHESHRPPSWTEWKGERGTRYWSYLLAPEWLLEWLVYWLKELALLEVLEYAGRLTPVLMVLITWFLEADERRQERHYRAWELINSARGSTGDGGRRSALQELNRDRVDLSGAPLNNAWLVALELPQGKLTDGQLRKANLRPCRPARGRSH